MATKRFSEKDDPQDDPKVIDDPPPPPDVYVGTQPSMVSYNQSPDPYGQYGQPQSQYHRPAGTNPCCCELRCGVLYAGIYGIVFYTISMIIVALSFVVVGNETKGALGQRQISVLEGLYYAGTYVIGLIFAIILTIGAAQKKVGLVKAAFFGYIVVLVMTVIAAVINIVITVTLTEDDDSGDESAKETYKTIAIVGWVLGIITVIGVYSYVLYVIYAYIKQLTREGEEVTPMGEPAYGQFPAGPPPPNPQQSYYQPTYPSMGPSQSTMGQGQGQSIPNYPGQGQSMPNYPGQSQG